MQIREGKKYLITFIDDCSRCNYVYLLRSKDETLKVFKHNKNKADFSQEK